MASCQPMYSHCGTAFSQLLTIVYANKHFFRSTLCLLSCVGFGWLFAFLVAFPYLFVNGFACSNSLSATILPRYTLVTTFLLPIIIVALCNGRILLYVRKSSRQVQAECHMDGLYVYQRS
jgi:hypothetical protein